MDRDDTSGNPEQDYLDDTRYDDGPASHVREEEYAAGQEEWQEQPMDDFVEEGATEQDGLPPPPPKRDPFAEEGPLEDDYVQQHGDEQDGMHAEENPTPQTSSAPTATAAKIPASLTKMLPYAGGGIAVLLLAFFGFQQFSGSFSEQPAAPPVPDNSWDTSAQKSAAHEAANSTLLAPEQPAPHPSPSEAQNAPTPLPPANTGNTMITPVENTSANNSPSATQPAPAVAQLESRIAELTQQIETMKQTQDQLNQKLQAATTTPPAAEEAAKAANQALIDRIAQLEEKLSASKAAPSSEQPVDAPAKSAKASKASKSHATRMTAADTSEHQDSEPPKEESAQPSKKASTDFMAKRKSKKRRHKSEDDDMDMSPAGGMAYGSWVLRSAQPGSAWLSQGVNSSDLRRVTPGEKVQGLGTIISIRQVAGRWVVEGTQGAVR